MLVTALAPKVGYDNAAKIAKSALKNKTTLKFEATKTGLVSEEEFDKIVDPKKMTYPEQLDKILFTKLLKLIQLLIVIDLLLKL